MDTVTLEVSARNCDLYFRPAQRSLRGRLDFMEIPDPAAGTLAKHWGGALPGQLIELDFTNKRGRVLEPLHDRPLAVAKLKERGLALAPREQALSWDGATLHYWTRRAVEAGMLRIVEGRLPGEQPPGVVQKQWVYKTSISAKEARVDKMIEELGATAKALGTVAQVLLASLPEAKRRELGLGK